MVEPADRRSAVSRMARDKNKKKLFLVYHMVRSVAVCSGLRSNGGRDPSTLSTARPEQDASVRPVVCCLCLFFWSNITIIIIIIIIIITPSYLTAHLNTSVPGHVDYLATMAAGCSTGAVRSDPRIYTGISGEKGQILRSSESRKITHFRDESVV